MIPGLGRSVSECLAVPSQVMVCVFSGCAGLLSRNLVLGRLQEEMAAPRSVYAIASRASGGGLRV